LQNVGGEGTFYSKPICHYVGGMVNLVYPIRSGERGKSAMTDRSKGWFGQS
jgi:hypothetical protein